MDKRFKILEHIFPNTFCPSHPSIPSHIQHTQGFFFSPTNGFLSHFLLWRFFPPKFGEDLNVMANYLRVRQ